METKPSASGSPPERSRDAANWARPVARLAVQDVPSGAVNLNVDGRSVVGPLQGFGPMWQKTYRVRLAGLAQTPQEIMQVWKAQFPQFQPSFNHFYPTLSGIQPGEILFIDTKTPALPGMKENILPIATGVLVLFVDDTSFGVMTPQGHPEAGWNNFSVYQDEQGLVAQIQSFGRSADPIFEFGYRFMGGAKMQEETWQYTLRSLAAHFGVQAAPEVERILVDPKVRWAGVKNLWSNSVVRTVLYTLAAPLRWLLRPFKRKVPGKERTT